MPLDPICPAAVIRRRRISPVGACYDNGRLSKRTYAVQRIRSLGRRAIRDRKLLFSVVHPTDRRFVNVDGQFHRQRILSPRMANEAPE